MPFDDGFENPASGIQVVNHQLVILGNGFDKACGLRSGFWEFFKPRMDAISRMEDENPGEGMTCSHQLRDAGITVWDLMLYIRKEFVEKGEGIRWCDVESAIADVLCMNPDSGDNWSNGDLEASFGERVTLHEIQRYFAYCAKHGGIRNANAYADAVSNAATEQIEAIENGESDLVGLDEEVWNKAHDDYRRANSGLPNCCSEYIGQFLIDLYPHLSDYDSDAIGQALLDELHLLESEFGHYLENQVASSADYERLSGELLNKIIAYDERWLKLERYAGRLSILDFNYTTPAFAHKDEWADVDCINIHGKLGGEIIFGADGSNCLADPVAAKFSKTYRLLGLDRSAVSAPVAYPFAVNGFGAKTVGIKFFGHSLARADYSYFQSIFDIVNLYGSDVRLYFLYTPHGSNARQDLLDRVAKLLDAYGQTLDNAAHGKNLMHKLLLEGRLVVQEI